MTNTGNRVDVLMTLTTFFIITDELGDKRERVSNNSALLGDVSVP